MATRSWPSRRLISSIAGRLAQNTLVATVMSNFGLDETLENAGGVLRTKVGDRYVIEAMMKQDLNVGGEQSGHMIFRDFTTTGDGIVSALQILRIMVETGKPLSELKKCLAKYPQAQRNLKVREKKPLEQLPDVLKLVAETEKRTRRRGPRAAALQRHRAKDPPAHRGSRRRRRSTRRPIASRA